MFEDAPLNVEPIVNSSPALTISSAADWPVNVWVEDLEVGFQDHCLKLEETMELTTKPILKENFEKFEIGMFPLSGGWRIDRETRGGVRDNIDRKEALKNKEGRSVQVSPEIERQAGKAYIAGEEFASGFKSFKLENAGGTPVSVVKQFSLPERVPFDVGEDNFAIVTSESISEIAEEPRDVQERGLRERKRGGRGERDSEPSSRRGDRLSNEKRAYSEKKGAGAAPDRAGAETQGDLRTLSASGGGSYYLYSFNGMLLAEYDINGNLVRDYIYVGGMLVAEYRPPSTYYYYTSDQINSTRIVTNDAGNVVYSAAFDPYGGVQKTWTQTYIPTLKFSGKERDGESGLDYFGARYYDKGQYRFISADPLIDQAAAFRTPQRWHLYAYCAGNPTTYFDPDGRAILIFIRSLQKLYLFTNNWELLGSYNASNNAASDSNGLWPSGWFEYTEFHAHPDHCSSDPISFTGLYQFDVSRYDRTWMGIHAGHEGESDEAGRFGWEYATMGCIRTTDEAMEAIEAAMNNDPITWLLVI